MSENNYFFVDGSALISDAKKIIETESTFLGKRLSIKKLVEYFAEITSRRFTGGAYKRFVFYFVKNENRIKQNLILPDFLMPSEVEDIEIKECGKRIKGSQSVDNWLHSKRATQKVLERFQKSEKAVDTQICCDALSLAAQGKIDRLFLYTNDYDYLPLCNALKNFGANVSLFRLKKQGTNKDLVSKFDSFSIVNSNELPDLFL